MASSPFAVPEYSSIGMPRLRARLAAVGVDRRVALFGFWLVVGLVSFCGVFYLPFFFPTKSLVYSAAYTVGGNNPLAAFAAAAASVAATLGCYQFEIAGRDPIARARAEFSGQQGFSIRYLYAAIVVMLTLTSVLGYLIVRSGANYADAGYFMTQLHTGIAFHRSLYTQFEFPYGPLLYAWPAAFVYALAPFGVSLGAAYMVSLGVMQAVGLTILYFTVRALPLSPLMKACAFCLTTATALDPQAGLNYTPFRFVLPITGVVLLARQKRIRTAVWVAAATEILALLTSPELGAVFAVAATGYAVYRAVFGSWGWLAIIAGVGFPAGAALLLERVYFRTMVGFATGAFNILLAPSPHIDGLLLCTVGIAPLAAAWILRWPRKSRDSIYLETGGLLLGIYLVGLCMLVAAFGRADPLHASFNGWGIYLVALIALDTFRGPWKKAALLCGALLCLYMVPQEYAVVKSKLVEMVHNRKNPYDSPVQPGLDEAIGSSRVMIPFNQPIPLVDRLTREGRYLPGFICTSPVGPKWEQRTIGEMRQAGAVLVPVGLPLTSEDEIGNSGLQAKFRFGYRYTARRKPFVEGVAMVAELHANWVDAGTYGVYKLYRRVR